MSRNVIIGGLLVLLVGVYFIPPLLKPNSRLEKVLKMMEWIEINNGYFHPSVEPIYIGHGEQIGMFTNDDLNENNFIAVIPEKCIVEGDKILKDQELGDSFTKIVRDIQEVFEKKNSPMTWVVAVYLFYNDLQGKNSFFYPYIQSLPQDRPYIYQEKKDVIKKLEKYGSHISGKLLEKLVQLNSVAKTVVKSIRSSPVLSPSFIKFDDTTLEEKIVDWWFIVSSRSFGFTKSEVLEEIHDIGMIPYNDMFNQRYHPKSPVHVIYQPTYESRTQHFFRVKVRLPCKAGNELFGSYYLHKMYSTSRVSNSEFFLHYGYYSEINDFVLMSHSVESPSILRGKFEKGIEDQHLEILDKVNFASQVEKRLRFFQMNDINEEDRDDTVIQYLKTEYRDLKLMDKLIKDFDLVVKIDEFRKTKNDEKKS